MTLEPEIELRPWAEQEVIDDASYRDQIAYLYERSPFYRAKLAAAGFATVSAAGGLGDMARLPLTEKAELKATTTPDNPVGAHLCAERAEIVRIYSTSGTTGTPSYIPLTASDLGNWVTGSARSYAASGVAAGERIVSTYNAGPFVAGAALAAFDRIGLCHIPVGTGNSERLMLAIDQLRPEAAVLTPSYAAYLVEWAAERGFDLQGSSVRRVLVAGEPGGGEPAFRAQLEQGWGARVTEAMGIGDIGPSLWGECDHQEGMHLGARGFVHAELIEPESGAALAARGRRHRRARAHASAAPRRAAPALPHPRSRAPAHQPVPVRPHRPARALHRAHRRHAHRARRQRLPLGRPRGRERIHATRERQHPGAARRAGRQAGSAVAGGRRARPGPRGGSVAGRGDRSAHACRARRAGPRRAGAVGQSAAQRIQVEARRARQRVNGIEVIGPMRKLQSQGVHHITITGADRQTSIDFWEGVLGMPFVFEQPNLDNESESHLYFDPGDGRLITVFTNEERTADPRRTPTEPGCVHHLAFSLSQATFRQAVERLDERGIKHSGALDRGFMDSIYFTDPLGLLIELASYRFEPPFGYTHSDVLLEAHKLRLARGDYNIAEIHLADAIEMMVARSRPSLSDDRSPQEPVLTLQRRRFP